MPEAEIVDMRTEARMGNSGIISSKLYSEINSAIKKDKQVIVFLNRRGFAPQIICPKCGYRMICDECGINMTYHKFENSAICHYCGKHIRIPETCPNCGNDKLRLLGSGTEKVEDQLEEMFPEAAVVRFDLDTAKNQRDVNKTISDFQQGRTDILVGTQILAKGLDFKNVGLVGVVLADVTLNIPDYRSSERTFQLLTQVAGRAGRDGEAARVIIQTYEPEECAIVEAADYDYSAFYNREVAHRKIMSYPPYSDIIRISFVDESESNASASDYAENFRSKLLSMCRAPKNAVIYPVYEEHKYGKSECPKVSFMIKAPKGSRGGYMKAYIEYRDRMIKAKSPCHIEIDVNPY